MGSAGLTRPCVSETLPVPSPTFALDRRGMATWGIRLDKHLISVRCRQCGRPNDRVHPPALTRPPAPVGCNAWLGELSEPTRSSILLGTHRNHPEKEACEPKDHPRNRNRSNEPDLRDVLLLEVCVAAHPLNAGQREEQCQNAGNGQKE